MGEVRVSMPLHHLGRFPHGPVPWQVGQAPCGSPGNPHDFRQEPGRDGKTYSVCRKCRVSFAQGGRGPVVKPKKKPGKK